MNMDHSAWEGFEIDGHVDWVMSRGTVIVDESGYVGTKGHGQFLKRDLSQYSVMPAPMAASIGPRSGHVPLP